MKIVVVSDTHGLVEPVLDHIKENIKDPDLLIHLGDYVEDGEILGEKLNLKTYIVAGNGDFNSGYKDDLVLEIEGKRLFLTHGHLYNIRYNVDKLYYKGLEENADIVLYGHNHIPMNIEDDGVKIFSPGSPNYPRDLNHTKSYGIIEISEGNLISRLVYMD